MKDPREIECDKLWAEVLAQKIKRMTEKYSLGPMTDDQITEMKKLRAEIEKLGFSVTRESQIMIDRNIGEFKCVATVKLFYHGKIPTSH